MATTLVNTSMAQKGNAWGKPVDLRAGTRAYVLFDINKGEIFHFHIRVGYDDTEQMRHANRLDWTLYPRPPARNERYLLSDADRIYFTGTIYKP